MQDSDKFVLAFGQTMKKLRENAGISQEKLAELADLERTFISWLETGNRQATVTTIFKLSKAFKMKPSEFIAEVEKSL